MPKITLTTPLNARVGASSIELGDITLNWVTGVVTVGLIDENNVRHAHEFSATEAQNVLDTTKQGRMQGQTQLRRWILERVQSELATVAGPISGAP